MSNSSHKSKKIVPDWGHIIPCAIGLVIVILIIVAVILLVIWDKGREFVKDPDAESKFKVETEDIIYLMPPETIQGKEDDGKVNIVMVGNDTLHVSYNGRDLSDRIAEHFDSDIVNICNISFPGSYQCSETSEVFSPNEYPVSAFSLFCLGTGMRTGDYSFQRQAIEYLPVDYDRSIYTETLNTLETIDFSQVDVLMIAYDGHDYLAKHKPAVDDEIFNIATSLGSMAATLEGFRTAYPDLQVVYVAPIFCYHINEKGKWEACDRTDLGYGNMATGLTPLRNLVAIYSFSYIDLFYGVDITNENGKKYLLDDGITPNEEGLQMMADRITKMIDGRLYLNK